MSAGDLIQDIRVYTPTGDRLHVVRVVRGQWQDRFSRFSITVELPMVKPQPVTATQALDSTQEAARHDRLMSEHRRLLMAFGLLTTMHPTMEIDVTDFMGMARAIVARHTGKHE